MPSAEYSIPSSSPNVEGSNYSPGATELNQNISASEQLAVFNNQVLDNLNSNGKQMTEICIQNIDEPSITDLIDLDNPTILEYKADKLSEFQEIGGLAIKNISSNEILNTDTLKLKQDFEKLNSLIDVGFANIEAREEYADRVENVARNMARIASKDEIEIAEINEIAQNEEDLDENADIESNINEEPEEDTVDERQAQIDKKEINKQIDELKKELQQKIANALANIFIEQKAETLSGNVIAKCLEPQVKNKIAKDIVDKIKSYDKIHKAEISTVATSVVNSIQITD